MPEDPEFRSALVGYSSGFAPGIINSQPGAPVDHNAPMPKWGWGEVKARMSAEHGSKMAGYPSTSLEHDRAFKSRRRLAQVFVGRVSPHLGAMLSRHTGP